MRILLVSHLYPPAHTAGTEVYTAELAGRLLRAGHEPTVFTSEKDIGRKDLELTSRVEAGVRVHQLISNMYLDDFEQSWKRPAVDRVFGSLLDELKPDVLHVHHLMYLSVGMLEEAQRREIAIVYTLHDFWLGCPRFGQLVHADGSLCERVDPNRCGTCLPSFEWRQSALKRGMGRAIGGLHSAAGIDLGPMARRVERWLAGDPAARARRASPAEFLNEDPQTEEWAKRALVRGQSLRELVLSCVDHFIAPSDFLRDWFIEWGIPRDRIVQLATGVDASAFAAAAEARRPLAETTSEQTGDASAAAVSAAQEPLQIAFLGTLVPVKGAHVLVDAWERLPQELRAKARLSLHGPLTHTPGYVEALRSRAVPLGIELAGRVERDDVPGVLARTDLLVVPSVWFENRPLVVLEAIAARTPLLVSEPGGMSELIEEGVNGWCFPMGDASALAAQLKRLIEQPSILSRLYREPIELPTWEALTEAQIEIYDRVRK
ncbi:MAG: glycosyltransferase involved in cell wall biosynthesis [Planctomycetota bacterium]|jgi:glycosyltransferase involved in cell wall biosynthesis